MISLPGKFLGIIASMISTLTFVFSSTIGVNFPAPLISEEDYSSSFVIFDLQKFMQLYTHHKR